MLIPIGVIAVFSFAAAPPRDRLLYAINDGFTLEYWRTAFSVPSSTMPCSPRSSWRHLATLASTAIGTLMAIALVRHRFLGRRSANLLIVLPMATPEIVIGASLLSMFLIYSVPLGFTSLLIAHIMFSISFVVIVVRSRLIGFDRSIEDAAPDPGDPAGDLPPRHPAPGGAGNPRRGPARVRALDRRLHHLGLQQGNDGDVPALRLREPPEGVPVQVNVLATMLFIVTLAAIMLVIWQQRRAERIAAVRPEPTA